MKLKLAVLCAMSMASVNAMACYTVYDRNNNMVYNSLTPPVDMRRQLHETVPVRFPGSTMIFGSGTDCPSNLPVLVSIGTGYGQTVAPAGRPRRQPRN